MKAEDALALLKESNKSQNYKGYVPSLEKDISLKPITVGHQKKLSKSALKGEDSFYKELIDLILDLSYEQLDLTKLNEIDKTAILTSIKENNSIGRDEHEVTCTNSDCKKKFEHKVDFSKILENVKNLKIENASKNFNIFEIKYTIELGLPSLAGMLDYRNYCKKRRNEIKKSFEDEEEAEEALSTFDQFIEFEYFFLFIRDIAINEDNVENFDQLSYDEKFKFLENFNKEIIYGEGGISKVINEKYMPIMDKVTYSINCPECNEAVQDFITIDNFFYI